MSKCARPMVVVVVVGGVLGYFRLGGVGVGGVGGAGAICHPVANTPADAVWSPALGARQGGWVSSGAETEPVKDCFTPAGGGRSGGDPGVTLDGASRRWIRRGGETASRAANPARV